MNALFTNKRQKLLHSTLDLYFLRGILQRFLFNDLCEKYTTEKMDKIHSLWINFGPHFKRQRIQKVHKVRKVRCFQKVQQDQRKLQER